MANKIGAIWRGKMKNGDVYFHGNIEVIAGIKTKIVLFPYKSKDGKVNPKAPAYNIQISEDLKEKKPDAAFKPADRYPIED